MAQSAFQAFQQGDEMPMYEVNTSDEDSNSSGDEAPTIPQTPIPAMDMSMMKLLPQEESKYISSSFTPNDDNTVYNDQYVIFGLKNSQNLIIRGQFTLEIQRGAVDINGVVYHSSHPPMNFLNPASNAIPVIQATQVIDSSKLLNTETEENQHLFTPAYKSVIKVSNLSTGLEHIGRLAPPFKSLFWNSNNIPSEELRSLTPHEEAFLRYTFSPVLKPDNTVFTLKTRQWDSELLRLEKLHKDNTLLKVVVIGGKNSGKSTFVRLLSQRLLLNTSGSLPIHVMDLDPGQPEYSKPDCISLNRLTEYQFGNHLSLTSTNEQFNHYIGFTSPKDQPNRYTTLVNDLIQRYESDGALKHESLLVNTPGWIKGYGLELTKSLIERLQPTHIVYLNSGTPDLEDWVVPQTSELVPLIGSFNSNSVSKYSSVQLRVVKTLGYFHKLQDYNFDFQPLLFTPPLQVTYGAQGIRAVALLGELGVSAEHVFRAIEAAAVAIYTVKSQTLAKLLTSDPLPLIDERQFNTIKPTNLSFKALALVHSINTESKLINLCTPEAISKPENQDFILVRAKTEIPIHEMANNEITKKFGRNSLPYISHEKITDYDKAWKVRKNVQRRGQR